MAKKLICVILSVSICLANLVFAEENFIYICTPYNAALCAGISGSPASGTRLQLKSLPDNILKGTDINKLTWKWESGSGLFLYNTSLSVERDLGTRPTGAILSTVHYSNFTLSSFGQFVASDLRNNRMPWCLTIMKCGSKLDPSICDPMVTEKVQSASDIKKSTYLSFMACSNATTPGQSFFNVTECSPGCSKEDLQSSSCVPACNTKSCSWQYGRCNNDTLGRLTNSPTSNNSTTSENNTFAPTFQPTWQPTRPPTLHPTFQPTFLPTLQPTYVPTTSPSSNRPTRYPTTRYPTYRPTHFPSYNPTRTWEPTSNPTKEQNIIITWMPTLPTLSPSRYVITPPPFTQGMFQGDFYNATQAVALELQRIDALATAIIIIVCLQFFWIAGLMYHNIQLRLAMDSENLKNAAFREHMKNLSVETIERLITLSAMSHRHVPPRSTNPPFPVIELPKEIQVKVNSNPLDPSSPDGSPDTFPSPGDSPSSRAATMQVDATTSPAKV